jgi:multiple sugar transport system ATP-binding protein
VTATLPSQSPNAATVRRPESQSASIRLVDIDKRFDAFHAVRGLNLEIREGELLVLLGPSGCGKTTTLNMLAGLERPSAGQLLFGDRLVNDVPPEERDIAMVFQSIALYPHLNVRENIGFALKTQKTPKADIARRVVEVARILEIDLLLDRRIHQLSGGQRQRVAIAKALVRRPQLFLLDEPFSSLDAELRRQMRTELIRIHREVETTMVFVTHDQEEAMAIADRIAVMNAGQIAQLGPPLDLYQAPRNRWVARFIGAHPINLFDARLHQEGATAFLLSGDRWSVSVPVAVLGAIRSQASGHEVTVGIRPEYISVESGSGVGEDSGGRVAGEVYTRQILGTDVLYEIKVDDTIVRAVTPTSHLFDIGSLVLISLDWNNVFVFDRQTEERIFPASA